MRAKQQWAGALDIVFLMRCCPSSPFPSLCTTRLQLNSLSDGSAAASNITCLLAPLQQLCALLSRELSTLSASADALDGSRPFLKACLNNLHVLEELLSTEPRSLVMQHSRQPQVGGICSLVP
jgi:hypothetical protein